MLNVPTVMKMDSGLG